MLHTSIGYHTFTIFKTITAYEVSVLLKSFKKYSKDTGDIIIYPTDEFKKCYSIEYIKNGKGINKWQLRICNGYKDFKSYVIEATINPKILAGIKDYITAANENYLKTAISNFDIEAKKISYVLSEFSSYKINRIDYCINFNLSELGVKCTPEQMMDLIKRSSIPAHFEERKVYDKTSHRMKDDKNSFYLVSKSVVINCYYKYAQLKKEYADCPSIEESRNIIRFEVQCKYIKSYAMSQIIRQNSIYSHSSLYDMLSNSVSRKVIEDYYRRIVLEGDYYTLNDAITKVKSYCFKGKKQQRLIDALTIINQSRSLSKAKDTIPDNVSDEFFNALRELAILKINPVTIPKDWKVKYIPNLLNTFYLLEQADDSMQIEA